MPSDGHPGAIFSIRFFGSSETKIASLHKGVTSTGSAALTCSLAVLCFVVLLVTLCQHCCQVAYVHFTHPIILSLARSQAAGFEMGSLKLFTAVSLRYAAATEARYVPSRLFSMAGMKVRLFALSMNALRCLRVPSLFFIDPLEVHILSRREPLPPYAGLR